MLEIVITVADWIYRRRLLLAVAAAAGIALLFMGLAAGGGGTSGLAGLVLLVWASFLFAMAHFFAGRNRLPPARNSPLSARLRWRAMLLGTWLALIGLGVLAGLLVLFTLRAISAI
jgi:hypothetical protein